MMAPTHLPWMRISTLLAFDCLLLLMVAETTAETCEDNALFFDETGAPCIAWVGYNCSMATNWGYTAQGKEALLTSCQKSCEICTVPETTSLAVVVAAEPTLAPSTVTFPAGECSDVPGFVDEFGSICSHWVGYDCTNAQNWGYTLQGEDAVLASCRLSCGQCKPPTPPPTPAPTAAPTPIPSISPLVAQLLGGECGDISGFTDEQGTACSAWVGFDCTIAEVWGYSQTAEDNLLASCQQSCGYCTPSPTPKPTPEPTPAPAPLPDGVCGDAPHFVDEFGSACSVWAGYDCKRATSWGYTQQGTDALLANCRQTCDGCTPPTLAPTPKPTPPPTPAPAPLEAGECGDAPGFVDELGSPCSSWFGYNCSLAASWGYTNDGTGAILSNCLKSCGRCTTTTTTAMASTRMTTTAATLAPTPVATPEPTAATTVAPVITCLDDLSFADENGFACAAWTGYDCTHALGWGYSQQSVDDLLEHCRNSCGTCHLGSAPSTEAPVPVAENSGPCEDVPEFLDEFGAPCIAWETSDCTQAEAFMYSQQGKEDLLTNCAKSCRQCSRRLASSGTGAAPLMIV